MYLKVTVPVTSPPSPHGASAARKLIFQVPSSASGLKVGLSAAVVARVSAFSAFWRSSSAWLRHCERASTGLAPAVIWADAGGAETRTIASTTPLEIHFAMINPSDEWSASAE